jgi:integrase/recombinase XerD
MPLGSKSDEATVGCSGAFQARQCGYSGAFLCEAIRLLILIVALHRVAWCSQIRAITTKKAAPQPVSWMAKDEMEALLAVPDRQTPQGWVEYALLLFLYNTGARVSEATSLEVGNLQISRGGDNHALVTLCGKRDKIRQCPLWPRTGDALRKLSQGRANGDPVFLSRHRKRCTWFGVYRLVDRCAARVRTLATRAISPHVVRHTTPSVHGLGMSVSIPPTSTRESISR